YGVFVLGALVLAGGGALVYLKLEQGKVDASATPPIHSSLPPEVSAAPPSSAQPSSGPHNASVPSSTGPAPIAPGPTAQPTDRSSPPAPTSSAKALPPFNETIARTQVDFTKNNAWICLKQGDPPTPVGGSVTFTGATGHVKSADVTGGGFAVQNCVR